MTPRRHLPLRREVHAPEEGLEAGVGAEGVHSLRPRLLRLGRGSLQAEGVRPCLRNKSF